MRLQGNKMMRLRVLVIAALFGAYTQAEQDTKVRENKAQLNEK